MNKIFLFSGLALVCVHASAQELNLKQAVSEAMGDSPVIQRSKSVVEESAWKRIEAYSGFLPTLNANGTVLADKKYVFNNITFGGNPAVVPLILPNSALYVNANLPLFDGFASTNTLRSAQAFEKASASEYEWSRFETQRSVTMQFYRAIAAKTLRDVAEQNVKMLEDHLKDARLFLKAGVSTKYDVLQVEVRVSFAKTELMNAEDNVEITQRQLAELMGHEVDMRPLEGSLPVLNPQSITRLEPENFSRRADISSLEHKLQSISYKESAASRFFVPKLALFGQYQFYNNLNNNITDTDSYRNAYQVGLNLTWNLFDGMTSIARSKQSVEQTYQTQKNLRMAKIKAQKDLDIWKRKYLYYCNVYLARNEDVSKANESIRLAREAIKVGSKTNTDLLDAESELFQAQAGVVNSQIGAIESLINLEIASGQQLYDFI